MSKKPSNPTPAKPARVRRPRSKNGWSVGINKSGYLSVYLNGELYTDNLLHMEWLAEWAKEAAAWMEASDEK